jgi:hypothetical protein
MAGETKFFDVLMKSVNLRDAFCTRYRCAESDFERMFFRRAVYRHALPLAMVIRWWLPRFFRRDADFIQWVGRAVNLADVRTELSDFEYGNWVSPHWLRTGFLIRLNPTRVKALAKQCLQP